LKRIKKTKLPDILVSLIIPLSGLVMLVNTFTHPPTNSYDYIVHEESIRNNQDLDSLLPTQLHPRLSYNPPLYYLLFGKINHLIELVISRPLDPYYLFRIAHILFIMVIAILYAYSLIPHLTKKKGLRSWFILGLFILPNLYLTQVMVRADHLLLLFVHLLFYFWFRFDFPKELAFSTWRICAWSICLIGMANSRNLALPAFLLFFTWGLLIVLPHVLAKKPFQNRVKILLILCATLILSSSHYAYTYYTTGNLFRLPVTPYNIHYYEKQKDFDRSLLFLNFQFDRLYENPNRFAKFKTGNSFLPRLYGDMWADHWLYFSGKELRQESKKTTKRIVLIYASLFTVFYFTIPVFQSLAGCFSLIKRKALNWKNTAALLFLGGIILFVLFVYDYSEVGKNSSVKFCYLLGYYWFPLFSLLGFLEKHPRITRIFYIYTITLYLMCIPLYIYLLRI